MPFELFVRPTATTTSKAVKAVLDAGKSIQTRLGLRSAPFKFRQSKRGLDIQVMGVAGSLSLREATLEIVPKFVAREEHLEEWSTSTLFLLESLAGKHVMSLLAHRRQWKSHNVNDLIGHAFLEAAERGLRDRPVQVYRQLEESSVVLRGRLNVVRQTRNSYTRPHLLECDVDLLDDENPFNDVLKWAASTLARTVYDTRLKLQLQSLAETLPGSAERSAIHRYMRLTPPPQFQAWSDALELARLLAAGMTLPGAGGAQLGYSLLFNMERAFERFVEIALSKSLLLTGDFSLTSKRQDWTIYATPNFEGGKALGCRPDNVVRRDGTPFMVVDAKYKVLDGALVDSANIDLQARPVSTDIYELAAGMAALGCKHGVLVYPSVKAPPAQSSRITSWSLNMYGTRVHIGAIPVPLANLKSRADLTEAYSALARRLFDFECSTTEPLPEYS